MVHGVECKQIANRKLSLTENSSTRTKFEHFGIIHFWVMLRINKQTNRRTQKSYGRRPTQLAWVMS